MTRQRPLFTLTFMVGIFGILAGFLKLGRLMRYVANSVMVGFVNGIAVLIILGQLGDLTGYDTQGANKVAQTIDLLLHLDQVNLPMLMVGIATILLNIVLERTRLKSFGIVGAPIVEAHHVAEKWVAEHVEPAEPAAEGEKDAKSS